MTVTIITNTLNRRCHAVLSDREWSAGDWKSYNTEIAGLPADMRVAGLFLALAYVLERAESASKINGRPVPEWVLSDLRRLEAEGDDPGEADRAALGQWVTGFAEFDNARAYMAKTEQLFRILDALKRHAKTCEILAGGRTQDQPGGDDDNEAGDE